MEKAAERCNLRRMRDAAGPERWWLLPALALAAAVAATAAIALADADRGFARIVLEWNQANGGKVQDHWWWLLPYYLPGLLLAGLAAGALAGWLRGARHQAVYLVLVVVVGCGLVANLAFKECWGRPRPRDTEGLGGTAAFQQPWQPGPAGRSFPSGHVTVPAACWALWLLWRRRRPVAARWSLVIGLGLCAWIGAARVLAGAHWLSDIVWSVALMAVAAAAGHRLLLSGRDPPAAPATAAGP